MNKFTRLYLLRHGETKWNKENRYAGQLDIPLNENGIAQAKAAAKRLKEEKIEIIASSDLQRAYKTAEIISSHLGINKILKFEELRELNYGRWQGKTVDEINSFDKEKFSLWLKGELKEGIPEGEKIEEFQKRVWKVISNLLENFKYKRILVVTHGGPVRIILCKVLSINPEKYRIFAQNNTGLTIIDFYNDRALIRLVNDICHLKGIKSEETATLGC